VNYSLENAGRAPIIHVLSHRHFSSCDFEHLRLGELLASHGLLQRQEGHGAFLLQQTLAFLGTGRTTCGDEEQLASPPQRTCRVGCCRDCRFTTAPRYHLPHFLPTFSSRDRRPTTRFLSRRNGDRSGRAKRTMRAINIKEMHNQK